MNQQSSIKAILVALKPKRSNFSFESSLNEMKSLAETAGVEVAATIIQVRDNPQAATYIGSGKLEELKHLIYELEPEVIIFDGELSPVQLRNLEQEVQINIVDRTMLILDIFSQRARSREGKLQVELASLEYRLPRLTGKGKEMSRIGGGIGARGAGEQKLELDRRYIRKRIQEIKKQMQKVQKTRELHKKRRRRAGLKVVSLVGYTNAGKSSLFNALCKVGHTSGSQQAKADNRLFQTLDTTTRKIKITQDQEILITDTVGFIQNLPHNLVAAFRSTLEEAVEADIILHVVDISDPEYLDKMKVAQGVLEDLGASHKNIITIFNKADILDNEFQGGTNYVSAKTGEGIDIILNRVAEILNNPLLAE